MCVSLIDETEVEETMLWITCTADDVIRRVSGSAISPIMADVKNARLYTYALLFLFLTKEYNILE